MMQTTEPRSRYNSVVRFKGRRSVTTCRRSLGQRNVGPVLVIIADILTHEPFQMALIHNDHMVQQFAAAVRQNYFWYEKLMDFEFGSV